MQTVVGGYKNLYSVSNLTGTPVDFDLPKLDFTATLAQMQTATKEVLSTNGTEILHTAPTIVTDNGSFVSGRFDALAPVPEPTTIILMLAGIGVLEIRVSRPPTPLDDRSVRAA